MQLTLRSFLLCSIRKIKREEAEESAELIDDVELGDKPSDLLLTQEMYKDSDDISHLHLTTSTLIHDDPDRVVIEITNGTTSEGR